MIARQSSVTAECFFPTPRSHQSRSKLCRGAHRTNPVLPAAPLAAVGRLALSTKALAALVRPGHRKPTPSIDPDEVSAGAGHRHASAMAPEQDPSPRRRPVDGEGRDGRGSTRLPPAVDGGAAERRGRAAFVFRGTGPPSSMSGSCAATRASRARRARHEKRGDIERKPERDGARLRQDVRAGAPSVVPRG